ncbi:MAG: hypothetical protein ACFCVD_03690 [Nodosilinea sp.]
MIAVIVAEMFNQTNWQRIYACKSDRVVRRSFLGSFLLILSMLLMAGLLGILAMHFGYNYDRAFFSLIQALDLPSWVSIAVLVLALVMSSLDSLLNGIASVFTPDLRRFFQPIHPRHSAAEPGADGRRGPSRDSDCLAGLQRAVPVFAG